MASESSSMRRERDDDEEEEEEAELSLSLSCGVRPPAKRLRRTKAAVDRGVFKCKTCSRQFPTFQALGGHRTSHIRPRTERSAAPNRSVHRCSVCGLGFPLGQALGGHMRRHKAMAEDCKKGAAAKRLELDVAPLEFQVVRRNTSHPQLQLLMMLFAMPNLLRHLISTISAESLVATLPHVSKRETVHEETSK